MGHLGDFYKETDLAVVEFVQDVFHLDSIILEPQFQNASVQFAYYKCLQSLSKNEIWVKYINGKYYNLIVSSAVKHLSSILFGVFSKVIAALLWYCQFNVLLSPSLRALSLFLNFFLYLRLRKYRNREIPSLSKVFKVPRKSRMKLREPIRPQPKHVVWFFLSS